MQVLLCGVRGSSPAPGAGFVRVGGHTSCVAVPVTDDRWLVLDAGTGLTRLAGELGDRPLRGTILLTHLHWDHTHGLPFLRNADRDDARVGVLIPAQGDGDARGLLARAMAPPHFPITPAELCGTWTFDMLEPGRHTVEGLHLTAADVAHKGGRTFGYRVSDGARSFAYLPDHSPATATPELRRSAEELAQGVDLLLHGGHFLEGERAVADAYGHGTVDDALALAGRAGVGRLVLVHHAPGRTDDAVAAIAELVADAPVPVLIGREGDRLTV